LFLVIISFTVSYVTNDNVCYFLQHSNTITIIFLLASEAFIPQTTAPESFVLAELLELEENLQNTKTDTYIHAVSPDKTDQEYFVHNFKLTNSNALS